MKNYCAPVVPSGTVELDVVAKCTLLHQRERRICSTPAENAVPGAYLWDNLTAAAHIGILHSGPVLNVDPIVKPEVIRVRIARV